MVLFNFLPYGPAFTGSVNVAAGTSTATARTTSSPARAASPGGVKVFSGADPALVLYNFLAFAPAFTGGIFVAAGDVNGDGFADVIVGSGAGAGPLVKVFDGETGVLQKSFLAYAGNFRGGVRVGAVDRNGDGRLDVITGAGPGSGAGVRVIDVETDAQYDSFFAFDARFGGGVYVAG